MAAVGKGGGLSAGFKAAVVGLLLAGGLLVSAPAAETSFRVSPKEVREEVKAVVTAQLTALQAGDFGAAYALAARGIKVQFDVRVFALLLKRGYAPLLKHDEADLGLVRDDGAGEAQVPVTVTDGLKRSTAYRYWLVKEAAGWRISGVVLEQRPPHGDI